MVSLTILKYIRTIKITQVNHLCGGLTFQIVGDYSNNKQKSLLSLKEMDFLGSFVISENSFVLVERFFANHSKTGYEFYHYHTNHHKKQSIEKLLLTSVVFV